MSDCAWWVILTELYPFIPHHFQWPWLYFMVTAVSNVKQFLLKILCYPMKLQLCKIVDCPDNIFWIAELFTTKHGDASLQARFFCKKKNWFAFFNVKVTVEDHIIKIWLELLVLLQLNLVWWHIIISWIVKRLDCSVVVKIKVTEKVQNSSDFSSERYLLSCWTFCNQIWLDDTSL